MTCSANGAGTSIQGSVTGPERPQPRRSRHTTGPGQVLRLGLVYGSKFEDCRQGRSYTRALRGLPSQGLAELIIIQCTVA